MPYNNGTGTVNTGAVAGIIISSVIFSLIFIIFAVIIYWRIFAKAGYSGAMGLLMFVPIANIVVLCILAFGQWPIYKELNYLRQLVSLGQQYPPSSPAVLPQQFPSSPQYPQYGQPQQYSQPQPGQQPQPPQYP